MAAYKLEMRGIVKQFPGVRALDGADFALRPGEVHAMVGMNGAGKSTLIKVLSGVYRRDAGTIVVDGRPVAIETPQDAMRQGIATVYQDPEMIPSFTGYENIYLGFETPRRGFLAPIHRDTLRDEAQALLERFPVEVELNRPVSQLDAVSKEIIAILRALSREMSILVLDEPTSILTDQEKAQLFRLIDVLRQRGVSIVYITHRLEEVFQVADRITVYRDGRNVATLDARGGEADAMSIAEMMLGERLEKIYPEKSAAIGAEFLAADGLSLGETFRDVSLAVHRGEVLGIFGLVGSGAHELGKALFGAYAPTAGTLRLDGEPVRLRSPHDAIGRGIFLVPGDRRGEGQFDEEKIAFNISLSNLKRVARWLGLVRRSVEQATVRRLVEQLHVVPPDIDQPVSHLSGGNQQKVVIGKGLFTQGRVFIFLEPTAGVDVGAKTGIYNLIRELSRDTAVIHISSDPKEIYGMADRAMAMFKGRVTLQGDVSEMGMEQLLLSGVTGGENRG